MRDVRGIQYLNVHEISTGYRAEAERPQKDEISTGYRAEAERP
jgi:hypothetical protein